MYGISADQQDIGPRQEADTPNSVGSGGVSEGVFARAYPLYDERGWPNSLKLPPGQKKPPPDRDENNAKAHYTGKQAETPSAGLKAWWAQAEPRGNIAQRMPECVVCEQEWFVIGIDTDHYGAKRGGLTLQEAEKRWGMLPTTYTSTSRDDGISKIRLYRIPKGVKLAGVITFPELGLGDIEIIQPHHRYLVCWPSIHPDTGNVYLWRGPDETVMDGPPSVRDIPELPDVWLEALREHSNTKSKTKGGRAEGTAWVECPYIIEQCLTEGEMSAKVKERLADATLHCYGGSRHDHILKDSLALLRLGKRGEPGVFDAMSAMAQTFVKAVAEDREGGEAEAEAEFMRMLSNKGAADRLCEPDDHGGEKGEQEPVGGEVERAGWNDRMVTGGAFLLDASPTVESLWGSDEKVIWPDGEGLMLTGTQGVGKTTLAQQLVLSLIGVLDGPVLGLPVVPKRRVLYLAMDRPRQIRRAFRRQCRDEHRDVLDEKLVIWKGPPPADLAKHPEILTELAEQANADVVVVDSLKDAALGLSDDEVGSGWNRAAQGLLATGRNLLVLHHRKKQSKNTKTGLDDVYGSTWLTAGMGSVVLLDGNPGDPLVEFRHLKLPVSEVGPMKVSHEQATGQMTVAEEVDLVAVAHAEGSITVKQAALLLFGSATTNEVEKARRKLEKLAAAGKLVKKDEGGASAYHPVLAAFTSSAKEAS